MNTTRLSLFLICLAIPAARADDSDRIAALLAPAVASGGLVTIPPGDYRLDGANPLPIPSHTTVSAHGARFHLPATLPEGARIVLFAGEDVTHFTWQGGEFLGQVFDPARRENTWEPNANTRVFEINTATEGGTRDILFRDVTSDGIAGAVIGVHGRSRPGSESAVEAWAERITLENCTLLRSGKFMWDYGYLWQILTWPEAYEPWEVERARRYFRMDLTRPAAMADGDDRVVLDHRTPPIPVSQTAEPAGALTFLGTKLPGNLIRGRQYFVVDSGADFLRISDRPGGKPIRFAGSAGADTLVAHNVFATYLAAYAPTGGEPGKGAFDITGARSVRVTGCRLSALGDTMHIQRCQDILFAHNHILGSRMGAFFLAEYCRNATITGNLVDGTNGSRVVSVEKSCTDVTMTGNTFRNGGRGAWINQPVNFVLVGNVFVNNTTKNEPDLRRGRRAYQTGEPGAFPELYFTLHEEGGTYGPVIVRDNVFQLGDAAPAEAVTFAPNGHDLSMTGNVFQTKAATIVVDPSCRRARVEDNIGAKTVPKPVDFHHGRR